MVSLYLNGVLSQTFVPFFLHFHHFLWSLKNSMFVEEISHSYFSHPVRIKTSVCIYMYLGLCYSLSFICTAIFPGIIPKGCILSWYCDILSLPVHSPRCLIGTSEMILGTLSSSLCCKRSNWTSKLLDEQKPTDNHRLWGQLNWHRCECHWGYSHIFWSPLLF